MKKESANRYKKKEEKEKGRSITKLPQQHGRAPPGGQTVPPPHTGPAQGEEASLPAQS